MSKKPQDSNPAQPSGKPAAQPATNNVVTLSRCVSEGCGKKTERDTFCNEHFHWFKAGLINTKGKRPKDFDKKYRQFLQKKAA
jgi:hypothetical protein